MNKSHNDDNTNSKNKYDKHQQRSIDEEKIKVKKQIHDLKKLISDIDFQLEITTFGEYKVIDEFPSQNSDSTCKSQIDNIDDILQYELFQMSGIYCAKANENEYVFNFSSSSSIKSPYSVKIFTENQTAQLENWVMPWGINIDNIVSETPLKQPKDIVAFLRNCKRNIDCHAERTKQFDHLKQSTLLIKNVRIDATLGYITILCYFLNIHDNSTNKNFDLIVRMHYGTGRVRPSVINFEWNLREKLSAQTIIKIKTFAKYFKTQSLSDAFKSIMEKPHPIYVWKAEEYDNSVLHSKRIRYSFEHDSNMEISDSADEDYFPKQNKKRIRKRGVKSLLGTRLKKKKLTATTKNTVNSDEHNNINKLDLSQNISDPKPQLNKSNNKISSLSMKSKSKTSSKLIRKKSKPKFHQTELNFIGSPVSKVSMNENEKKKTVTSTPMNLRHVTNQHQTSVGSLEISPITEESTREIDANIRSKKLENRKKKKK
ncbi:hypothetical protein PV327_009404 [Microctonus hyperodae]|uniref:Uncharacterized protein n=1 Tax=Microctonus hyperodae TaxID=165561 RepID=A0AA39FTQ1_MICHY|nr:hypothetical protein PV327_009404 [Microctonus hyperodae]